MVPSLRLGLGELGSGLLSWMFQSGDNVAGETRSGSSGGGGGGGGGAADAGDLLSGTERDKMLRDLGSGGGELTRFDYPKDYCILCMEFRMERFDVNLTGQYQGAASPCCNSRVCGSVSSAVCTRASEHDDKRFLLHERLLTAS